MNDRKKIGVLFFAGLVVLSAMAGIASAQDDLIDPPLWLYIEGSTYNPSTSGDDWIAESWVNPVEFSYGGTYTDYVDVIVHQKNNYAKNPYFFVWVRDNTLISNITVGQAQLFEGGSFIQLQGDSEITFSTTDFEYSDDYAPNDPLDTNPSHHQGQIGYWVRSQIGDVPCSLDFSYGNPVPEPGESYFNPDNLTDYVRVPVTYTLTNDATKDLTTLVIHYDAHNTEGVGTDKKYDSYTPNSHDSSTYNVPEFATIAIPVAMILGLLFFFNHRKKRGE